MREKRTAQIRRGMIYGAGVVIQTLGITLNTKTQLGVSAIISLPFSIANAAMLPLSAVVFFSYAAMVGLQLLIKRKAFGWKDVLQLPLSMVLSLFLEWFGVLLDLQPETMWQRLLILAGAIVCSGVGMAMMICMQLVSNPSDGLAQAIGGLLKKDVGLGKNILDFLCVAVAMVVDITCGTIWTSVGIGTVAVMVLTGRVVALFHHLFRKKLLLLAGLQA